jgi:hypothetical protein
VHPANEAEALDLASRALDALAAEWEGTTTLAQDEELLAGAALSARGRTFVQFRALRKRVIAVNRQPPIARRSRVCWRRRRRTQQARAQVELQLQ